MARADSTQVATSPRSSWRDYQPLTLTPVLRHSLEAFVEHGYYGTSVRDIARRLGQTVPAIYYHHKNKQALLVALLNASIDEFLKRCKQAEAEAGSDPVRRLRALVECSVLFVAHRRELSLLDGEIRSLDRRNRQAYAKKRDRLESAVVSAVEDGIKQDLFSVADPDNAARAIITMCRGIAAWYRLDGPLAPDDLADQYVTFALRLVGMTDPAR